MNSSDELESASPHNSPAPAGRPPAELRQAPRLLRRQRKIAANWDEIGRFLDLLPADLATSAYSVCLLSDRAMRRYNQRFRQKQESTDVLSFPAGPDGHGGNGYLGDILISVEMARRNARRHHLRLEDEIKALILHGLLHLRGEDHERDGGQMARRERRWGARLGLPQTILARPWRAAGRAQSKAPLERIRPARRPARNRMNIG